MRILRYCYITIYNHIKTRYTKSGMIKTHNKYIFSLYKSERISIKTVCPVLDGGEMWGEGESRDSRQPECVVCGGPAHSVLWGKLTNQNKLDI